MHIENIPNKPTVFVMLPFSDECLKVYKDLKLSFSEKYYFVHAGDMDNQQNIIQDIVKGITTADIIIADLTGSNPNVFYELGLAHALNKKTIIITQDISELPFDIKSYRAYEYSMLFYKYQDLRAELEKLIDGAMTGETQFGNPVLDYAKDYIVQINKNGGDISKYTDKEVLIDSEEADTSLEEGFLDRIAIIEENSELMVKEINSIGEELNSMNKAVEKASSEMDKVGRTGGSSTAVFARNTCRKLADPIADFGKSLSGHVSVISSSWEKIENNYLALLSDRWMDTDENRKSIQETVEVLNGMKETIVTTNEQVEFFKKSMNTAYGIERRLNQAIKTTVEAVDGYLTCTDVMTSSIGRIETRAKMVLGEGQLSN